VKIGRLTGGVYVVSALGHIGLGAAVSRVEASPRPDPPPIEISVVDAEPEPEPPPPPPEPKKEEPEPEELEAPEPEPVAPPKPPPKPAKAPAPAAAPAPAGAGGGEPFDSGLQLGNGAGGTNVGGGGGGSDAAKPTPTAVREVVKKKRVLDEAKPTKACADAPTKPKPLSMPEPEYTAAARAAGIVGKVRLSVTVGPDGEVKKVSVIESLDPDLDAAARKAVQGAKFEPATECGAPTSATFKISVKFTL
jgi:periplasmic protein TonB